MDDEEKIFNEAVTYYIRQLRAYNFVKAYLKLEKKYGDLKYEVQDYCLDEGITYRGKCGRILLTDGYK